MKKKIKYNKIKRKIRMQRKKERTKELKRWNGESKKFKIMVERKNEKEKKQMDRKEGKKGEGTKKN